MRPPTILASFDNNVATVPGQEEDTYTLPEPVVGTLAKLFAALGEPTRLQLVHALSYGERRVGDLAAMLGIAVPAVSQHLRVLRELHIVRNRRDGKMVYYALDDAHVADLFSVALTHVQGTMDHAGA